MRKRQERKEGHKEKMNMQSAGKGKLKIFFSYADGVGKTYTMLRAAEAAKNGGTDAVVGFIHKSDKDNMDALLSRIEKLNPLRLTYKNQELEEFDLDGAIRRHPRLILVDEMAHANASGGRHRKRYQDIQELLRIGIDVYTTVNVQNIESLSAVAESITGKKTRDTIPDRIFDAADQVELVDMEPDEMIRRMGGDMLEKEKLLALREIAMRRMADRIHKITRNITKAPDKAVSYAGEHVLTCISSSMTNEKVLRTAARMSEAFHAYLTALYVETPDAEEMTEEEKRNIRENIQLAEKLGARVITVYGDDIAQQIAEYSRFSKVSKIVIGRTKRGGIFGLQKRTLSEKLTQLVPKAEIYIIPSEEKGRETFSAKMKALIRGQKVSLGDTLKTCGILVAATAGGKVMDNLGISEINIILLYIVGVVITAMCTRNKIYSVISSIISVITFNFFFTLPKYSLKAYGPEYPMTFMIMFLVAFLISTVTTRVKRQAHQATEKAYRTEILLETSQKLQQARGESEIVLETAEQIRKLLGRTVIFYVPDQQGNLKAQLFGGENDQGAEKYLQEDERAVAQWVYKNNKHAGATTDTLPGAKCLYMAVRGEERAYAVVGIALDEEELESFERSVLITMLGECALALEKDSLDNEKREVEMNARQERLRANLLRAISHDLRTPLTGISGNASVLIKNGEHMEAEQKKKIYEDIYDDAMWLINLVENLLSVTRIENGNIQLRIQTELMEDVVAEAMHHINRKQTEHKIQIQQEDEILLAKMDTRLIVQVFINIIDNAIKYTQKGSTICVRTFQTGKFVKVEIADNGKGVADEDKEKLFDMFYTANNQKGDSRRGLGLGLALCKAIIHAHGGEIGVTDNHPQGSIFYFTLPAQEVVIHE